MKLIAILLLFPFIWINAQNVTVPESIEFAGMKLHLTDGAQKLILADIQSITRNQKYFSQKIDRANLYFPLIEKIFKEENFPSDFKYLALQESSLVSDVVSTSNAVGYWQFKKESAEEVGLRVDREIDERMNIVASTRGAAKYLRKNNYFLNNWVYTLLAFNLGRGGVASSVKEKYRGATEMEIDKNMHWYVIRFLAHKLAYENLVGKYPHPELMLQVHPGAGNKTIEEVAGETKIPLEDLQFYNKWALKSKVPGDKAYALILPIKINQSENFIANLPQYENAKIEYKTVDSEVEIKKQHGETKVKIKNKSGKGIVLPPGFDASQLPKIITYNKLKAIQAREGDNPLLLAYSGKLSVDAFLKRNEMQKGEQLKVGHYYYLESKRGGGLVTFHTVETGETLWEISQKYGMRMNNIRKKNRMKFKEDPLPGRVLWLNKKRPKKTPVEYKTTRAVVNSKKIIKESEISEKISDEKKEVVAPIVLPEVKIAPIQPDVIKSELKQNSFVFHTIETGQTLYSISKLYNTKVDSLRSWNELATSELKIGTKIIVGKNHDFSGKESEKVNVNIKENNHLYIVKPGDTIYKISKAYKVSIQDLKTWNNKTDYNVSIGEQIIISK